MTRAATKLEPESLESMLKDWPPHMRLPDKYRDGSWWCVHRPGCDPIACGGHKTFTSAVRQSIKNIRKMRRATPEQPR